MDVAVLDVLGPCSGEVPAATDVVAMPAEPPEAEDEADVTGIDAGSWDAEVELLLLEFDFLFFPASAPPTPPPTAAAITMMTSTTRMSFPRPVLYHGVLRTRGGGGGMKSFSPCSRSVCERCAAAVAGRDMGVGVGFSLRSSGS